MRKLMILFLAWFICGLSACVDDDGNYNYLPQDLVTIELPGSSNSGSSCIEGTEFVLEPQITWKNPEDEAHFTYTWLVDKDTISHDKVLKYVFPEIKDFYVSLYLTDERTNISYKNSGMFILRVETRYKTGFMVLYKESSGTSRLGFIKVPGNGETPDGFEYWNEKELYKQFHEGEDLGSNPVRLIQHFSSSYSADDQVLVIQRGGQGPLELDGVTLKKVILTEHEFVNEKVPEIFEPVDVCYNERINLLLNSDGSLYNRMITVSNAFQSNAYSNIPMNIDVDNGVSGGNITLLAQPANSSMTNTILAYDATPEHKRFILVSMAGNNRAGMAVVSSSTGEWPENYVPLDNLGDYNLIYACPCKDDLMTSWNDSYFYFILKDVNGKHWIQSCYMPSSSIGKLQINPVSDILKELPKGDQITAKTKFLCHRSGDYLFFTGGINNDILYCYQVNTNKTTVFFNAGATITALSFNEGYTMFGYTGIAIGTANGKVHFVDASRNSIISEGNPTIYKEFEGYGEVVDIIYKHTSAMMQYN